MLIQIHGVVKHANHLEHLVCRHPVEDEVPGPNNLTDVGHRAAVNEVDAAQACAYFFTVEATRCSGHGLPIQLFRRIDDGSMPFSGGGG